MNSLQATPPANEAHPVADWKRCGPDSPFGELLRQALAADDVAPGAAALWMSEDPKDDQAAQALSVA